MQENIFPFGSVPRSTATFRDATDDLADPTTITVVVTNPAGVSTSYQYGLSVEVIKSAVGVYYIDLTLNGRGWWTVVWTGTGNVGATITENLFAGGPTAADWVTETEAYIFTGAKPELNFLTSQIAGDMSITTVPFDLDAGGITRGAYLSIDLEEMFVRSVSGQNATVVRAVNGSQLGVHLQESTIYVNAKHSKYSILRAVNQEIRSLQSAGLFEPVTVDLTYNTSVGGYDLANVPDLSGIIGVYANYTGVQDDWAPISSWDVARNQDLGDFPSGFNLRLFSGGQTGRPVRVVYKGSFQPVPKLDSDVTFTGLPETAYDIPPIGAAARLTSGAEIGRNDITRQGNTRRPSEVPPGAIANSASYFWNMRKTRLGEELMALKKRYPNRTNVT